MNFWLITILTVWSHSMINRLYLKNFGRWYLNWSVPVPQSSCGLSGDELVSRAASTFAYLKASVPRLVNQTEQVVFVLIQVWVWVESFIIVENLLCSWAFELRCSLVTDSYWLYLWYVMGINWLDRMIWAHIAVCLVLTWIIVHVRSCLSML